MPSRPLRPCVYCGVLTFFQACAAHRDLLRLDPYYNEARAITAAAVRAAPYFREVGERALARQD